MADPIPYVVAESGEVGDAPDGAIPIGLFGGGGGGGGGAVDSVNGKTGEVVLSLNDIMDNSPQAVSGTGNSIIIADNIEAPSTLVYIDIASVNVSDTAGPGVALTPTGVTVAGASGSARIAAPTSGSGVVVNLPPESGELALTSDIPDPANFATAEQGTKADSAVQPAALSSYVPTSRTVAGKPLSSNVTLSKGDVGLGNVDNTADSAKTFTASQISDFSAAADERITASTVVVKTSGNQTISGTKTFSTAPVVPDASFSIAKTSGLQSALNAKVGSGNASVISVELYNSEAELPATGTPGVIYLTPAVG